MPKSVHCVQTVLHCIGTVCTLLWRLSRKFNKKAFTEPAPVRSQRVSMPPSTLVDSSARAGVVLTSAHLAEAQQLAERLYAGVRMAYECIPREHQPVAALARYIGMERTVCQRLISAVANGAVSPETLTRVPAPKTIMAIADALIGMGQYSVESLRTAAEAIDEFFLRVGGSQRAFGLALYRADAPMPSDAAGHELPSGSAPVIDDETRRRQRIFELGRQSMRARTGVQTLISIHALSTAFPGRIDLSHLRGVLNHQSDLGGVPLAITYFRGDNTTPQPGEIIPPRYIPDVPPPGPCILENFCSTPLPTISQRDRDGIVSYIVNSSPETMGQTFDLVMCDQLLGVRRQPGTYKLRIDEMFAFINYPCEALIFDVYLHRSLAIKCIPGLDVHVTTPTMSDPLKNDRWVTRLPSSPDLIVLGAGLAKASSKLCPRQAELTAELFRRYGYNPAEFVGFRCEERYPEWRMSYRMFFDYSEKHTDE